MSEKIIALTNGANTVSVIFLVALAVLGVVCLVHSIVMRKLKEKKEALEIEAKEEVDEFIEEKVKLTTSPLLTESEDLQEELKELEENHKIDSEEYREEINEYRDKLNKADFIGSTVKLVLIISACILFYVMTIVGFDLDADSTFIRPIENSGDSINATAYYVIDFEYVDQDTLTVFVKNNTKQELDQATVFEVKTGESTVIENLDPGQEKIVSFEIYPNSDDEYQFEIKDIQFK